MSALSHPQKTDLHLSKILQHYEQTNREVSEVVQKERWADHLVSFKALWVSHVLHYFIFKECLFIMSDGPDDW